MSERRLLLVLIAVLLVPVGLATALLPLLELNDPVRTNWDTGAVTDLTRGLLATSVMGAALAVGALTTAIVAVRRHLGSPS